MLKRIRVYPEIDMASGALVSSADSVPDGAAAIGLRRNAPDAVLRSPLFEDFFFASTALAAFIAACLLAAA